MLPRKQNWCSRIERHMFLIIGKITFRTVAAVICRIYQLILHFKDRHKRRDDVHVSMRVSNWHGEMRRAPISACLSFTPSLLLFMGLLRCLHAKVPALARWDTLAARGCCPYKLRSWWTEIGGVSRLSSSCCACCLLSITPTHHIHHHS
jgi:hypothetical protein